MAQDYYARRYFENTSAQEDFAVTFPYLLKSHVIVQVTATEGAEPDILVPDVDFEWTSGSLIHALTPITAYEVFIFRQTPSDDLIDRLAAPSTVTAEEINVIALQLLYLIQEAFDAGLAIDNSGIGTIIRSALTDLRYTYDIPLAAYALFSIDNVIGPIPVARDVYLPEGATGSYGDCVGLPADTHVFQIVKNIGTSGAGGTVAGTVSVSTAGAVTFSVASDVIFAAGDSVALRTSVDGGDGSMFNFGLTLRMRRTDTA